MPAKGGHMPASPTPASQKIYVIGSHGIRVPMREVNLSGGEPPVRLYDTSGPYTDPEADLDVKRGLPPLRLEWIVSRGDVEELAGPSSGYRQRRGVDPSLGRAGSPYGPRSNAAP